jgi:hypothetical protein
MSIRIINSGSTEGRPMSLLQLLVQIGERDRHENIDTTQQVVLGNAAFEPKLVEQTAPIAPLPPHHRPALRCRLINQPPESQFAGSLKPFFDSIGQELTNSWVSRSRLQQISQLVAHIRGRVRSLGLTHGLSV